MIKVAIVDDEKLARAVIEGYCAKLNNLELVLSTGNPFEFINFMQNNEIHLVFLDIEMPELSGMGILRSMINPPKVILTTAYSEYALESYNFGVVDYLLKPIKLERFLKAINKVSPSTGIEPRAAQKQEELQIKHEGVPINIPFHSIFYIQSFGNYLKIYTHSRMYLISETLTNIATLLPAYFQRTHKSYIANLQGVTKASKSVLTIDSKEIPVSPMYKILVLEKLENITE